MAGVAPPISVVIPAHNASNTLVEQLDALDDAVAMGAEIIVVDNASRDDTAAIAARNGARVVPCQKVGTGAARNAGIRAAASEKIGLCDADDVVGSGWAAAMRDALDRYDLAGGLLDYSALNSPLVRELHAGEEDERLGIDGTAVTTACMGVRRSVWRDLGGFDEALVFAFEDIDFVRRARAAGFTVGHAPDAIVAYRLRADPKDAARRAERAVIGLAQYRAKHGLGQPWKATALSVARHSVDLASVWRCTTSTGRWRYRVGLSRARGAVTAWRRYRIAP